MPTGAQVMVECLIQEGVETVFGYPGAAICPFYDSLYGAPVRHVLTRGEQAAGHAASGYARASGKAGVCVATSGPGATNLFTAIATAYMDSIPLVAITGQVRTDQLGRDVFQEVDTTGAAEPFTKYTFLVKHVSELPRVFKEAFHIATTGRRGPVLIDVPVDVQMQQLKTFTYPKTVNIRGYKPHIKGHPGQIRRVISALSAAKRPLLFIGGGVNAANAQDAVRALCEQFRLPVVSTMMGIGVMPSDHPLYFGMIGQSGRTAANSAVKDCDVLIIIGARVGDRAVHAPQELRGKTIVHIDIDSAEIGKNLGTTIPLVGDAQLVVQQLLEQECACVWEEWISSLAALRKPRVLNKMDEESAVRPRAFMHLLCEQMDDDALFVSDVGQNQVWSALGYITKKGRFFTTGGMGTMGYALPAAIGVKTAQPQRQVVAACGDGAFAMTLAELATAVQEGCAVKLVVMNNSGLGLVREIQRTSHDGREIAVALAGPDLEKIAQAYGIRFLRVRNMADAPEAIRAFLDGDDTVLMECIIDPKEDSK